MGAIDSAARGSWRKTNLGFLLDSVAGMVIDAKLKRLHAMGHGGLSEAQLSLYVHLDIEGTRLTALADRAALTKQSMIELIDRAEVSGFVTRAPDPQDGRAKIVRFTPTGRRFLSDLGHATVQVEAQLCETLGADRLRALKACLSRYAESPCEPGGGSASGVGVGDDAALSWRIDNAGRVFGAASRRFGQQVVTSMHGLGHADLSPAQLALYRNLDLEGSRLTDLAIRARITKPSMRELVGRAVRLGHVSQRPDPQDRRSRRICFTAAGLRLLDDFRSSVETTETRFGAGHGPAATDMVKASLELMLQPDSPLSQRCLGASAPWVSSQVIEEKRRKRNIF